MKTNHHFGLTADSPTKRSAHRSASATSTPLLLKTGETCKELGGIHPRTLARLEQRGLIRSVKLLRHKLYAMDDLRALVAELRNWKEAA